ncbi:MAG TPA: SDR family oxidoreductase [Pyrinomonadaceae bacterium]|jgi:NAD(P)-dependent dehydrogenase (short-subunit alcohol dehydrogenase family)
MSLFSRNIVILGISSDIGAALARMAAANKDCKLLLVSRKPEAEMRKLLGKNGLGSLLDNARSRFLFDVDLTKEDSLRKLRQTALSYFKEPFSVIHSVGDFWYHKRLIDMKFSEIRMMMESHILTFAGAAHALVPVLIKKGGGRLVAFSCNSVLYNYPDMAPFTSSKAAIETFIKCLAHEYAEYGIAATALALPTILTEKVIKGKEIQGRESYVTPEELSDMLLNQVLTLPLTVNGNIIEVYKYNPTFYHSGYFQRNPRPEKAKG